MEFPKELSKTSTFRDIIDNNCVYVDKTDLIAKFASQKGPFVFFRPRGFGKSTLISSLQDLFEMGLDNFHSLKIGRLWYVNRAQLICNLVPVRGFVHQSI